MCCGVIAEGAAGLKYFVRFEEEGLLTCVRDH